jgi:hypothetical protein
MTDRLTTGATHASRKAFTDADRQKSLLLGTTLVKGVHYVLIDFFAISSQEGRKKVRGSQGGQLFNVSLGLEPMAAAAFD